MRILRRIGILLLALFVIVIGLAAFVRTDAGLKALGVVLSPILDYANSGDLTMRPDRPWRFAADFRLGAYIRQKTGYRVEGIYRCDHRSCGFDGRYVAISFPSGIEGGTFITKDAYRIWDALAEPIPGSPSPEFRSMALQGVGSREGAFVALQLDADDKPRAEQMLNAIVDRWHKAWDACRAAGKCPPVHEPRSARR
jgi:hypothetical protein